MSEKQGKFIMPQTILFHDTIVARNQSSRIDFPIKIGGWWAE